MQRVFALIALVFAFAALSGTTMAHAHRFVSTPIVVLNHVDADNVAIPVIVSVQQGQIELDAGIVMPCGPHHAIAVEAAAVPRPPQGEAPAGLADGGAPLWPGERLLRPPRAA